MTKANYTLRVTTFALITLAAAGCASTGTTTPEVLDTAPKGITYEVKPGDRLGDIALSITGNIADWQRIASYNGIEDPRTLAAGDTIVIPNELLPDPVKSRNDVNDSATRIAETTRAPLPVLTGNGVSVAQTTKTINEDIAVHPVSVNRSFNLQPFDELTEQEAGTTATTQNGSENPTIRVVGTYYPKGIYAEPASYAELVQRVAPGSTFVLDSIVNDWYKIVTDEGFGYIRQSDSVLE